MERDFSYLKDKYGKAGAREKFEKICTELFKAKFDNTYNVRVNNGDGGIDIFVGDFTEEIDVYQCKYFINGIGKSQKEQIKESFKKAIDSDEYKITNWYLCVPCELSKEEHKWWSNWKKEMKEKHLINIDLYDGEDLLRELEKNDLYDKHFNTERIDKEFFSKKVEMEKKEGINKDFREVISHVYENDFYIIYTWWLNKVEELIFKYRVDSFFIDKESPLLQYLEDLSRIAVANSFGDGSSGVMRDFKKYEKQIFKIRTKIVKEYHKLIKG